MEKYRNVYRIKSTRLQNWDYGFDACYYVTLCTSKKIKYFGSVDLEHPDKKGTVILSEIGKIASECWRKISDHFPFVSLDEFVVMPNHIHGVLIFRRNKNGITSNPNDYTNVETRHALSLQPQKTIGEMRFQNQGKNTLSSIIGSYKSSVTRYTHREGHDFAWQSRFYDHVIRNEDAMLSVQNYIKNNPIRWLYDKLYVD